MPHTVPLSIGMFMREILETKNISGQSKVYIKKIKKDTYGHSQFETEPGFKLAVLDLYLLAS